MDRQALIEGIRTKVLKAIDPIKQTNEDTKAESDFLFRSQRTNAGYDLPAYYLVYFLFADLLQFKNLGKFEKVAWSFPIDYNGEAFLIEYRKMGIGVFARDAKQQNEDARKIVHLIKKGIFIAKPFFELLAKEAVDKSQLNVTNKSIALFKRYNYFISQYKKVADENKAKEITREHDTPDDRKLTGFLNAMQRDESTDWLAMATIDAFFSWTEYIFIHISILKGYTKTGIEVANLAQEEWLEKYKAALPLSEAKNKVYFDKLRDLRRQLRNYVAHGAFGREGEAFNFHSPTGAVPVILHPQKAANQFSFGDGLSIRDEDAISLIESFVSYLFDNGKNPAMLYVKSGLPIILPHGTDGVYAAAMSSTEKMSEYIHYLGELFDNAVNMDW